MLSIDHWIHSHFESFVASKPLQNKIQTFHKIIFVRKKTPISNGQFQKKNAEIDA